MLSSLASALDDFVKVNGTNFYLNGKPFYFAGTNAYYLWYSDIYCSSPATHQGCAVNLLDSAKALNLTVIRTWGSSEGSWGVRHGFNFQPNKGVYDEATFVNFDKVIKEAGERNIKLIVALINNWDSFGGMCQYVKWCGLPDANLCEAGELWPFPHAYVHDSFYTDDCTKGLYKNYTAYFLNRTNSITGIKYKDDPTIMAWELANEPRCRSDKTGETLNNWIGEMSAYIKTIDSNHLVTVGIDGGYVNKNYKGHPNNWWHTGGEGQDFIRNHEWGNIDFATFNYYDDADRFDVNQTLWIQEHIEDSHNIIGKPVILQEFNTIDETNRASNLSVIYGKLENFNINGDTFWMLSDFRGADEDGFEVLCPEDTDVCNIISGHADYMNSNCYSVGQVINGNKVEHRFYCNDHHFLTIIDDDGTFNIRPHPGLDVDGWGSSWYMQPFLPGAVLKHTTIESIIAYIDGIEVKASGYVSKGAADTYGTWNTTLKFTYGPIAKEVNGDGSYGVKLAGSLSSTTGDLNLFKIASNYLDDVPLLTGGIGDTGDMQYANVIGNSYPDFIWNPPTQPAHFPGDQTDYLSIDVSGELNEVDTAAQGYVSIEPAYKPSLKVVLDSTQAGIPMIFGGIYDLGKSQDFWEDNIGITPLILQPTGIINYNFDVEFNSKALPGDPVNFYSVNVSEGWNLISIPYIIANKSIEHILKSIDYSKLFYYNSGWKVPEKINNTIGFWIKANSKGGSDFKGLIPENVPVSLRNGWNLVGYPYLQEKNVLELFESDSVYSYNGTWSSYIPNRPFNSLTTLKPGYGYWIKKI